MSNRLFAICSVLLIAVGTIVLRELQDPIEDNFDVAASLTAVIADPQPIAVSGDSSAPPQVAAPSLESNQRSPDSSTPQLPADDQSTGQLIQMASQRLGPQTDGDQAGNRSSDEASPGDENVGLELAPAQPTSQTGAAEQPNPDLVDAPTSPSSPASLIEFAGGAVRLQAPANWNVYEVSFGREVRLLLTPAKMASARKMPRDGVWLTCHVYAADAIREAELQQMVSQRRVLATGDRAVGSGVVPLTIHTAQGFAQEFAETTTRQGDDPPVRGFHALVRTSWGVCEVHASTALALFEQRRADFDTVLAQMQFTPVAPTGPALTQDAQQANPILGSWKAYRSRLRLFPDSRIEIVTEPSVRPLGEAEKSERLSGRFQAKQDVLFVRWD
ncbi:MAG: hypothetical protein QF805_08440, partial [Pirellulaceae bacterium]|nr:hypothetical protein [Pirellulaceae bacterium]